MNMCSLSTRVVRAISLIAVTTAFSWGVPALADQTRNVDLREAIGAGATLEIDDVNGAIVATPTHGNTVTVHAHATTTGSEDPGPVVRTSRQGNRLVVCAVFTGNSDATGCSRTDGGNVHHLTIDLTVGVPRGVRVEAHNVNGAIRATKLEGPVDASDVNGTVTLGTNDTASASTVNGAIHAQFSGRGDTSFKTVNGGVDLVVPANADATFHAETLSGAISSSGVNLTLTSGQFVGHSATATLGAGRGHISVHTIDGNVRLERR